MQDGAIRAAIALPSRSLSVHGWITLVMKDGAQNAMYLNEEVGMDEIRRVESGVGGESEPVAEGKANGGLMFVF